MALEIILASTSRIRQKLLDSAGLTFSSRSPVVDEELSKAKNPDLPPQSLASLLAREKALSIAKPGTDILAIGADQVLAFEGHILNKPSSPADAATQLLRLRGRTHCLISAISCAENGRTIWNHVGEARLTMRDFSDSFLCDYVATCGAEIVTSVGGYKLEERGIQLFSSIEGDYFDILGLPLLPLLAFLRQHGVVAT